jgi:hypothetical protein
MRLTLRTMLAFLDDILEPSDAEEIRAKIEESKFASDLVHRIRNSTQRLRLGAPPVSGPDAGLDANTVAEYLDNTLDPDAVPDFEKTCLENEVYLAEVASCHQVLALVLGEPAEIDETLRERAYRIDEAVHQAAVTDSASQTGPSDLLVEAPEETELEAAIPKLMETQHRHHPRSQRGLAPHQRSSSSLPLRTLALTLVCGFVLAVVALRAVGPFGSEHPVWKFLAGGGDESVAGATPEAPADAPGATGQEPLNPTAEPAANEDLTSANEDLTQSQALAEDEGGGAPGDAPPGPVAEPVGVSPDEMAAADVGETGTAAMPEMAADRVDEAVAEGATDGAPAAVAAGPATVGRYISEKQVLARFDEEDGAWSRLPADSPLAVGDQLVSLPAYRPQVALAPHLKLTISGATRVSVDEPVDADTPALSIPFGRIILVSVADEGARLALNLAGHRGIAVLTDAASELAVEVVPEMITGSDPRTSAGRIRVRLYVPSGDATWEVGGIAQPIRAGQVWVATADSEGTIRDAETMPPWIDGGNLSLMDRRASSELEPYLDPGRPLSLSLAEKTEFRLAEVRALASRCLCSLDQFEPILEMLNDESQRSYWHAHFDALRGALGRSPESAVAMMSALESLYGPESATLFRLLCGFSPPQLEAGAGGQLIDLLEHERMIARVLAFENLRRITGKSLLFRPEQEPGQERSKVVKWRQALERGELRYPAPPPSATTAP